MYLVGSTEKEYVFLNIFSMYIWTKFCIHALLSLLNLSEETNIFLNLTCSYKEIITNKMNILTYYRLISISSDH